MPARRSTQSSPFEIDRLPRPLLCVLLALCCLAACSLGSAARRPFMLASEMQENNERLARRYMALKYETQELERRVAEQKTEEGRDREARRRGYLKKNETRLTFLR